jgi:hypothetical protein
MIKLIRTLIRKMIRKLFKKGRTPKQIKEEQIKEAYRRHFYGL